MNPIEFHTVSEVIDCLNTLDVSVMKLGTERIKRVLAELGDPQNQMKTVHVVGTNGKGSICATAVAVYEAGGYKTGLFTSPHLLSVTERIQLGGKPLSEAVFVAAAQVVYRAMTVALPKQEDWLTYFEFLNAMAFWVFADQQVDIAFVEAGLGGRLDSTNTIKQPEAVVVSPISLDHVQRLGPTLTDIANEKTAVFRQGVPVITTAGQPSEAMAVIMQQAQVNECPLVKADPYRFSSEPLVLQPACVRRFRDKTTGTSFETNLLGRYQDENRAIVFALVEQLQSVCPLSDKAVHHGLKQIKWPGRYMYDAQHHCIVDGSHNDAGFQALVESLAFDFPKEPIYWGVTLLENRSFRLIEACLTYQHTTQMAFLRPSENRSFHHPHVFDELTGEYPTWSYTFDVTIGDFLNHKPASGLRVITGSLYSVGEVLKHLSLQTPSFTCS